MGIERRHLLRLGAGLVGSAGLVGLPGLALAKPKAARHGKRAHHKTPGPRRLAFRHLHTGETLEAVYWEKGEYVPDALEAINKLLRDFRTEEVHPIDTALLDLLNTLRVQTGSVEPFRIISAFRSSETNEKLRAQSAEQHAQVSEVAKKSLHMEGKAMDIRLNDVALTRLRAVALNLKRGGVGYYPDSGFVHVDVGAVRQWQGT